MEIRGDKAVIQFGDEQRLYELKEYFVEQIGQMEGVRVNGIPQEGCRATAPHVASVPSPESEAKYCCTHWRRKGSTYPQEAPVLPTSLRLRLL